MATTAELERLDALLTRLIPLTQASRGELIIADDWNTIVSTIIELGRAVYSEASGAEIAEHTHIDGVSLAWLNNQLRTLISGGSLKDPIQEGKLNTLERKITRVNSDVAARLTDINATRAELDRLATRELDRESSVQNLDRRVQGLRDAGEEIGQLRLTLDGISNQITTVQNIADQLSGSSGEIIDVSALQQQVNTLTTWREQLRDANGELLTGIGIDQKIAEALNTLVTEDELNASLDTRLNSIEDSLSSGLDSQISVAVDQRLELTLDTFRDGVNSEMNRQFEGLDGRIAQAVTDELPGLQNTLLVSLQANISSQFDELQSSVLTEVDTRTAAVRNEFLQANQALRDELNLSIDAQFEGMQSSILTEVDARTNAVLTELLQADQVLRDELNANINNQFSEFRTGILNDIGAENAAMRTELLQADQVLRDELNTTISGQLETLQTTILNQVDASTSVVRDELLQANQTLRDNLSAEFNRQFAEINQSVQRLGSPNARLGIDDFTAIRGISTTQQNLLQTANIRSYADLAGLSPEQVARITRMPVSQVVALDIIGQAQNMRTQ